MVAEMNIYPPIVIIMIISTHIKVTIARMNTQVKTSKILNEDKVNVFTKN